MLTYTNWKEILRTERLPAVLVDLDAFDRNLDKLAAFVSAKPQKLRVATKSIRVPELIARVLKKGRPFEGVMCFSCEEAYYLAHRGLARDFLIAYPSVQKTDLMALREIHEKGMRVTLTVDSLDTIRAVAAAMVGVKRPFPIVLDVDMSLRLFGGLIHLGVRRSPVRGERDLMRLIQEVKQGAERFSQVRLVGMMGYEAQVAGLGDRNPFKKWINPFAAVIRKRSVKAIAEMRKGLAKTFVDQGLRLEIFNGGGTGSLNYSSQEPWLTELTAGSALLCPHLFDYYSNIQFEPACFFALQVVRQSDRGYATCLGGGYVASGEPGWDKVPLPYLPEGLSLVGAEGCGEVQTPLKISDMTSTELKIGDPVLFRHAKAGELAERFNEYLLVSGGKTVGRTKTYRGSGLSFF